jgi:hypothetical protein
MMTAPQIIHVEELVFDSRTYSITVARVAGGLAGHWRCPCGEVMASPTTHLTIGHAVQDAKRELAKHYQLSHAKGAQSYHSTGYSPHTE